MVRHREARLVNGRRFPPPWRVDKIPGYVVRDAFGQATDRIFRSGQRLLQ
jgi:hypothetical protein